MRCEECTGPHELTTDEWHEAYLKLAVYAAGLAKSLDEHKQQNKELQELVAEAHRITSETKKGSTMTNHETDYDNCRERLFAIFDGERATFADRIHIINFIDNMHNENASLERAIKHRDVQLGIMVDKVGELRLENRMLCKLVAGMQVCEDDDADAHDCPLYDEDEPTRCAYGRVADELGLS